MKSSYHSLYFDGTNDKTADLIGNFFTTNHSDKIKSGNILEVFIADDIKENSKFNFYKKKSIMDSFKKPCVIASCKFSKEIFKEYNLTISNKKEIEADLVIIDENNNVSIVEVKNGCVFDTKKSKGEITSLELTKILCERIGFRKVDIYISSYDATVYADIKIRTVLGNVQLLLYEELAILCGLASNSRDRINRRFQEKARSNLEKIEKFIRDYQEQIGK